MPSAKYRRVAALWSRKEQGKNPTGLVSDSDAVNMEEALEYRRKGGKLVVLMQPNKFKAPGDKKPDYEIVFMLADEDAKGGVYTPEPEDAF